MTVGAQIEVIESFLSDDRCAMIRRELDDLTFVDGAVSAGSGFERRNGTRKRRRNGLNGLGKRSFLESSPTSD